MLPPYVGVPPYVGDHKCLFGVIVCCVQLAYGVA